MVWLRRSGGLSKLSLLLHTFGKRGAYHQRHITHADVLRCGSILELPRMQVAQPAHGCKLISHLRFLDEASLQRDEEIERGAAQRVTHGTGARLPQTLSWLRFDESLNLRWGFMQR